MTSLLILANHKCVWKMALDESREPQRLQSPQAVKCFNCNGYNGRCPEYQGCVEIINADVLKRESVLRRNASIMGDMPYNMGTENS